MGTGCSGPWALTCVELSIHATLKTAAPAKTHTINSFITALLFPVLTHLALRFCEDSRGVSSKNLDGRRRQPMGPSDAGSPPVISEGRAAAPSLPNSPGPRLAHHRSSCHMPDTSVRL